MNKKNIFGLSTKNKKQPVAPQPTIRIGHGYDVHAFTAGDKLTLGGVDIAHNKTLLAHSDGDVLIHAICDAMLGALGLGDIGKHFPDTSEEFRDIDSRKLLVRVANLVNSHGYKIGNIDTTIVAQEPKMQPHIAQMRDNIATDCNTLANNINIKATTTEKLGYCGREEGLAAHAVCILIANS